MVYLALIELRGVSKVYGGGENTVRALDNVSLSIKKGEFVAIVGHSGSGKSTMMNILGCLDTPNEGEYYLNDKNVGKLSEGRLSKIRNREIGFVFQSFNLIPNLSACENVELPLSYRGISRTQRRSLALDALAAVGLSERAAHNPSQLSGGQQQRVAIARAIAARPPIILADEPTGNLDTSSEDDIIGILQKLNLTGRTIVVITHGDKLAAAAKRRISLVDGRIVTES